MGLPRSKYDEKKWKPVYKQTSPFLAKVILAYRYGVDKDNGRLAVDSWAISAVMTCQVISNTETSHSTKVKLFSSEPSCQRR